MLKINEIENETKRKLNVLDDEISNILEKLNEDLTTLELRCRFCEKSYDFEKERELRLSTKERINDIKRRKEKTENNKDKLLNHLLDGETKIFELLTDLEYERQEILNNIATLESKLTELKISPERIGRIKNSFLISQFTSLQKQVEFKKQSFNNKSLIVYNNHVLVGFYLCQSRIHRYYGFNSA